MRTAVSSLFILIAALSFAPKGGEANHAIAIPVAVARADEPKPEPKKSESVPTVANPNPVPVVIRIVGPINADPYTLIELAPEGDVTGAALIWDIDREEVASSREYGTKLVLTGPPGVYKIKLRVIRFKDNAPSAVTYRHTVTIGVPTPPVPPIPVPPIPPNPPVPPPGPAPIPLDGFRVLILYEEGEKAKYPESQLGIMYGKTVRDYLNTHCVKGSDGTPERRIYDKDVDASGDGKHWTEAMKRSRTTLPWVIISTGKSGYEGPLPKSVPEMMELLKKYGGE